MSPPDVAEALPYQDIWEAMQYLEANILGNPRLPSSVKFLIGIFAANFERRKHVSRAIFPYERAFSVRLFGYASQPWVIFVSQGNAATLFGTADGRRLQLLAQRRGWPLLWGMAAVLNPKVGCSLVMVQLSAGSYLMGNQRWMNIRLVSGTGLLTRSHLMLYVDIYSTVRVRVLLINQWLDGSVIIVGTTLGSVSPGDDCVLPRAAPLC